MAIFTSAQLDEADEIIDNMEYKAASEYDSWYPTEEELNENITGKTKGDALFLMWLSKPAIALSSEQNKVKKHIIKMLYRPEICTVKE